MSDENGNNGGGSGGTLANRTEQAINKVNVNANYLAQYIKEDDSLDILKEHRTVPRFKIIQATSDADLTKNFGIGTVIVRPGDAMICKFEADPRSFDFVPLFFFAEYAKWRDLKGSGPMILERNHDATSEVAQRSKNAKTRKEAYEGQENVPDDNKLYYSYVEHLRFIGVIYGDHPLVGTPVTLSFERGEWGQGKNFISAVSLRRQTIDVPVEDGAEGEMEPKSVDVPLWAQVWRLRTVHHAPDATRKWYGFHFESPKERSIVLPEEAPEMQRLHLEFKELFKKQRLMVIDDEQQSAEEASVKAEENF